MKKFILFFSAIAMLFIVIFLLIDTGGDAPLLKQIPEVSTTTEENISSGSNANGLATVAPNATMTTQTLATTQTKSMQKDTYTVTMKTNKGEIILELNSKIAPNTVKNFVELANTGFYNGVRFHRVIKGFMIQGGDPLSKDPKMVDRWGTGGPGYKFADEIFDEATYKTGYKRGVIAMANSGKDTNGSQFFIMHADYGLPPSYTIFGKVIKGLETVDAIAATKVNGNDRPLEDMIIESVTAE
jgi:peptidylprolyl isomerase